MSDFAISALIVGAFMAAWAMWQCWRIADLHLQLASAYRLIAAMCEAKSVEEVRVRAEVHREHMIQMGWSKTEITGPDA